MFFDATLIQVPPVFAAARNALYSRYTDNDWMASNMSNYLASNRVRGASERVRHDTVTMCHELDDKTKRTQVCQSPLFMCIQGSPKKMGGGHSLWTYSAWTSPP